MRKTLVKIVALCMIVCMLLTGCSGVAEYFSLLSSYLFGGWYSFEEMEYIHPQIDDFRHALDACCSAAETETNFDKLIQKILQFNAVYDQYATARALSTIHYCTDMTDAYWEAEYNYCEQISTEVMAGIDRLYRLLAKSPLREQLESADYFGADFFVDYEGQTLFDDTFTALLEQETELKNEYYAVYAESGDLDYTSPEFYEQYGGQMEEILVELVLLRQQIGAYAGYESYSDFAYDFYYARDFHASQITSYLADIRAELVPLYRQLAASEDLGITLYESSEEETYAYVEQAAQAMGGTIQDAFVTMTDYDLYDISYGEHKYNASFEVYISGYQVPYVFLNPTQTEHDKLTFAHEFGHFCNDYASYGSMAGIDVAEIFSQGMEYLSLCYSDADENLTKLKLLGCLCVYVEQAAYAAFEEQLYQLPAESVTAENLRSLFSTVCADYGISDGYSYTLITHFYTNPMYVISYVVSNDAALQLYQMETTETGTGLACFAQNLVTTEPDFLAFLETAGLESPFADGRIQQVKQTLQEALFG